jgi:hypothetical protein
VRIKCAVEALLFVHPKLSVVANVAGKDFAERLEAAIARSGVTVIEHEPQVHAKQIEPPQVDHNVPPHIADRRFKRRV